MYERLRKAKKAYQEFPFLWAVDSDISSDLDIKVKPLDTSLLSMNVPENTRVWIRYDFSEELYRICEVEEILGKNLAAEIVATIGNILRPSGIKILYLVFLETNKGFRKNITVYRPKRESLAGIPLYDTCLSVAYSTKSI